MKRFQFSIRSFLGFVGLFCIACAALAGAAPWIASVVYTVNLVVLWTAIAMLCCRRGTKRVFWLGAVVFGWGYFATTMMSQSVEYGDDNPFARQRITPTGNRIAPVILTDKLLDLLAELRGQRLKVGSDVYDSQGQIATIEVISTDFFRTEYVVAGPNGNFRITPDQVRPTCTFYQIGHSVFDIVIALVGGILMTWMAGESGGVPHGATGDSSVAPIQPNKHID